MHSSYEYDWRWGVVIAWSGIRGVFSLLLAPDIYNFSERKIEAPHMVRKIVTCCDYFYSVIYYLLCSILYLILKLTNFELGFLLCILFSRKGHCQKKVYVDHVKGASIHTVIVSRVICMFAFQS